MLLQLESVKNLVFFPSSNKTFYIFAQYLIFKILGSFGGKCIFTADCDTVEMCEMLADASCVCSKGDCKIQVRTSLLASLDLFVCPSLTSE